MSQSHELLRVGYVINQYPKPSHTFITNEIRALEAQGVVVARLAMRGWDEAVQSKRDAEERDKTTYILRQGAAAIALAGIAAALRSPSRLALALASVWKITRKGGTPLWRSLIYLAEAAVVARHVRIQRLTHLHAHFGTNPAAVAMLTGILADTPFSFTVHGPEEFDRPLGLKLTEKIRAARFVMAISSFGRSQLYRWADKSDWEKIEVVRCGLEQSFFEDEERSSQSGSRFICVGRLCEQKGQLLLLEAFAEVVTRHPEARLVLAGDGPMRSDVESAVGRLGLSDSVSITGWLGNDAVRDLLKEADCLVLASFAEGLPVVLMEAMALNRPVISTYVAGIPELVRDGENGFLIPAGDVGEISRAMSAFLRLSPAQRAAMGDAGRGRAAQRHSALHEAEKLKSLFSRAVGLPT